MKKVFLILVIAIASISLANATVYVRGYMKSNGTYVAPHTRTNPDGIEWNNRSYRWN